MQPLLGFRAVNGHLLQCLFDKCCVPFLPLEVLVAVADCPVQLCFCVTVPISIPFFYFLYDLCFCIVSFFLKHMMLNVYRLCFLGSSQNYTVRGRYTRFMLDIASSPKTYARCLTVSSQVPTQVCSVPLSHKGS